MKMAGKKKNKQEVYSSWLIRCYVPWLYGKPIYDENGNVIRYKIPVPKMALITPLDLVGG